MDIEVKGLKELIAKLDDSMLDKPLRNFFNRATITIQGRARTNAPVGTSGQLRNFIVTDVDQSHPPLWAKVGVMAGDGKMLQKARAMEFGTGLLAEGPNAKGGRHFPPWGARNPDLELWAKRHGFPNGFVVARIIGRRGGLKPRRYLRDAFRDSMGDIKGHLNRMASEIQSIWAK
jgi:hypothetical protein